MKYLGVCKFKNGSRYRVGFDSSTDKAKKRMSHLIKAHFSISDIYDRGGVEKITIYELEKAKT